MSVVRAVIAVCILALATAHAIAANPKVEFETSSGVIVIELYPEKAPKTVENFLRYVQDGFYRGTVFHRVIPGFMIQGGGFTAEFQQKPVRDPVSNEADNGLRNEAGTIAMARTPNPHSATAQFFINVNDNPFLDHVAPTPRGWGYCVFGKVIKGMDVAQRIVAIPTGPGGPFPTDVPRQAVLIENARLLADQ